MSFRPKVVHVGKYYWPVQWYVDNRAWWEKVITGEYLEMYDRIYGPSTGSGPRAEPRGSK